MYKKSIIEKKCDITGLIIKEDEEWSKVKFSDSFSCSYKILGSKTIVIGGIGYTNYEDEKKSIEQGYKIVNKYIKPDTTYLMIQDWKEYINSSGRARNKFIKDVVENNRLHAVIFCNATTKQELSVILGHKLGILSKELRVCRTYKEAALLAHEFEKTGRLPKVRITIFSTIINIFKYRNKKIYSAPVLDLLEYLNSIDWTSDRPVTSNYYIESGHPLLPIFDALTTIKSQLDKTTKEKNKYLNDLLEHKSKLELELEHRTLKIREGEEFFSKIIQNSPIANFILDNNLNIIYINKKAEEYQYKILENFNFREKHPLVLDIENSCNFILKEKLELLLTDKILYENIGPFEAILYSSEGLKRITEITFTSTQTGILLSVVDITEKKEVEQKLYIESVTDHLTKFYNRRYFQDVLSREFIRAKDNNHNLSLLMFDIDHFKKINDSFGHPAGDSALIYLSNLAREFFRSSDLQFRIGGEEFTILLLKTTSYESYEVAEKFRTLVEKSTHRHNNLDIKFTISIGVASIAPHIVNTDDFLKELDVALYKAKESGRNRTVLSLTE